MLGGWVLACGGRYESNPRESDPGVSAASGSGGLPDTACESQVAAYRQYWAELFAEYGSLPCHADTDCRSFYFQSPCDPSCTLLTSAGHRVIVDQLNAYASNCNADCWPQPMQTCPDALPVHCVASRCQ